MKMLATSNKGRRKNGASSQVELERAANGATHPPDDMAANHDFYLHGTHKQNPRRGRWIPASQALRQPTRAQVEEFNRKMDEFAGEIERVPADLSKNLDRCHGG